MTETTQDKDALKQRLAAAAVAANEGRFAEAARLYGELVRAIPDAALLYTNLGVVLGRLGKLEAAVACFRRALALKPDDAATMSRLGNALRLLGRAKEGATLQSRALVRAPGDASIRYNLALTLRELRRRGEALRILNDLHEEFPGNAEYELVLGITHLQAGEFRKGFAGYEARWRMPGYPAKLHDRQWNGEDIAERSILVQSEPGFADALQFVRYIPQLTARKARIVLECEPALQGLFSTISGVEQVIPTGAPAPPTDFSVPLVSLARVFATTRETIPVKVPYLRAPGRATLPQSAQAAFRVGLLWAGEMTPNDRSWPLVKLAPLLEHPRIAVYSLQTGPRVRDLEVSGFGEFVYDLAPHLKSFAELAAVMEQCDLVITIDGAAAHLAGALGRPTWLLLRHVADWRWLDERSDSPWYPTMRLFRQRSADDFDGPVSAMLKEMERLADTGAATARPQAAGTQQAAPKVPKR